jgi:NAD(P)-dependent dehydrogenase (short-subunit alcohol dehydrogenase family)
MVELKQSGLKNENFIKKADYPEGSMQRSLTGKVILVTGGGSGLGEATSIKLAEAGALVFAVDINDEKVRIVVEKIKQAGGKAEAMIGDIGDEKQTQEIIEKAVKLYGRIDVLINNAGTDVTLPVDELTVEQWDRVQKVNIRGPFLLSHFCLPIMKRQKYGQIINIVSTAAKRAWANASAYHASKWGLLGFSHALHVEARPFNIKVTALVCGGMRTPFLLDRFPDIDINTLQEPCNVAETIEFILTLPEKTVIPELMVIPLTETSWP